VAGLAVPDPPDSQFLAAWHGPCNGRYPCSLQLAREDLAHLKAADSAGGRCRGEAGCFVSHETLPGYCRTRGWTARGTRATEAHRLWSSRRGRPADVLPRTTAVGACSRLAVLCRLRTGACAGRFPGRSARPVSSPAPEHDSHGRASGRQQGRSGHHPGPSPPGRSDIHTARRGHEHLADLRRDGVLDRKAAPLDARRGSGARPIDMRRSPHRGTPGAAPGQLHHAAARVLGPAFSAQDIHVNLPGAPSRHTVMRAPAAWCGARAAAGARR
jgi:hypothetical protein